MHETSLPDSLRERLIQAAIEAAKHSYSPYSKFPVGAALYTQDEQIITGCNVENASFGLTICAEQTAMVKACSQNAGKPLAIAVISQSDRHIPPCGRCRQFLAEFNYHMTVISCTHNGDWKIFSLSQLLPFEFSNTDLPI
ncbi:MAG: cytidine deaminase [Sumerlaeia bacterium]